jgi:hypothetical protein
MRTHGNKANLKTSNPYAAAAENATAMQRAADVRKNLTISGSDIKDTASPEEAEGLGTWMNPINSHALVNAEYHTAAAGWDLDFG